MTIINNYSVIGNSSIVRIENVRSAGMSETLTSYPALPTYSQLCSGLGLHSIDTIQLADYESIGTFEGCYNMIKSPTIPSDYLMASRVRFDTTYEGCSKMTSFPFIPENTTFLGSAFGNCTNLTGTLIIPSSVTKAYESTFYGTTKSILIKGIDEDVLISLKGSQSNVTYEVLDNKLFKIKINGNWINNKKAFIKIIPYFHSPDEAQWTTIHDVYYKDDGVWKKCQKF